MLYIVIPIASINIIRYISEFTYSPQSLVRWYLPGREHIEESYFTKYKDIVNEAIVISQIKVLIYRLISLVSLEQIRRGQIDF